MVVTSTRGTGPLSKPEDVQVLGSIGQREWSESNTLKGALDAFIKPSCVSSAENVRVLQAYFRNEPNVDRSMDLEYNRLMPCVQMDNHIWPIARESYCPPPKDTEGRTTF